MKRKSKETDYKKHCATGRTAVDSSIKRSKKHFRDLLASRIEMFTLFNNDKPFQALDITNLLYPF